MLCRTLRDLLVGRWAITGLVCFALIGSAAGPSRISMADGEPATIAFRAPDVPLAALATTCGLRLEKHATSVRLTHHKPERNAHVTWATRPQARLRRPDLCQTSLLLARRFLPSRHPTQHRSDEPRDPFLAQLSLS